MFVPQLKGEKSQELGNPNFQHPNRNGGHFGPNLDRFSTIVIYLALSSIVSAPTLTQKYSGGEGILFKRDDFVDPFSSPLLRDLENIAQLSPLVKKFRNVCLSSWDNVPSLSEFISDKPYEILTARETVSIGGISQGFNVISSSKRKEIINNQDNFVIVIGKVMSTKQGLTIRHDPYAFLSLGDWKKQCFTVVIWSETLSLLHSNNAEIDIFEGEWISVSGVVSIYESEWGLKPQIVLESPADISIITEEEAKQRLSSKDNFPSIAPIPVEPTALENNKPTDAVVKPEIQNRIDSLYSQSSVGSPRTNQSVKTQEISKPLVFPNNSSSPSFVKDNIIDAKLNKLYTSSKLPNKNQKVNVNIPAEIHSSSTRPAGGNISTSPTGSTKTKKTWVRRFLDWMTKY